MPKREFYLLHLPQYASPHHEEKAEKLLLAGFVQLLWYFNSSSSDIITYWLIPFQHRWD